MTRVDTVVLPFSEEEIVVVEGTAICRPISLEPTMRPPGSALTSWPLMVVAAPPIGRVADPTQIADVVPVA